MENYLGRLMRILILLPRFRPNNSIKMNEWEALLGNFRGAISPKEFFDEQANAKVIVITIICFVLVVLLVLAIIFKEPIEEFLSDFTAKYLNFSEFKTE